MTRTKLREQLQEVKADVEVAPEGGLGSYTCSSSDSKLSNVPFGHGAVCVLVCTFTCVSPIQVHSYIRNTHTSGNLRIHEVGDF